jgi:hypothetical protein
MLKGKQLSTAGLRRTYSMLTHRFEATSYEEAMEALSRFEFPVDICDTTGRSNDKDYPDQCWGDLDASIKLDWIFDFHNDEPIIVEISGHPKTLAQHLKEKNGN